MNTQTIYGSHEHWGEPIYANEIRMQECIKLLLKLGDDWKDINISDTTEYELVGEINRLPVYSDGTNFSIFSIDDSGYYYPIEWIVGNDFDDVKEFLVAPA